MCTYSCYKAICASSRHSSDWKKFKKSSSLARKCHQRTERKQTVLTKTSELQQKLMMILALKKE